MDTSLVKQLELLLELQAMDVEIMSFEDERDEIPKKTGLMEEELLMKQKAVEDKESMIAQVETEISEKERLLELEFLKIKNTRNKETAIQNIKQYEAYVKEIENQEESSEDYEGVIKDLKKKLEQLNEEKVGLVSAVESISNSQTGAKAELEKKLLELDDLLEGMYDKRDAFVEQIPENVYLRYEYIAERVPDGIAIASLDGGTCSLCNMAVLPQVQNEIMAGKMLHTCQMCNRILVYKAEETDEEE